ncbi:KOW domain-containing RNA-binding protein [Clostridium sp. SYSU_GA19001]|nr:KOW domain-containing RNA-binding protein [Clostridium caldaquaticum]
MFTDYVGRVAYSKSGRDAGRIFIITSIIDEDYVYITDGDLRPVEKPKKKKIKHLKITDITASEIKQLLKQGDKVSNRAVKKFLQSMSSNEEV